METGVTENSKVTLPGLQNVNADTEKFQKFIYELFEKNGILNDLRAYLRGHIINVLKTAKTGVPHACQKHFTQRLELTFQALNILIAEYFLRFEFNYSLSVFVSEIPLANMVFGFAKSLMEKNYEDQTDIKFTDSDVWCILNYLGVQCDSEHASNIIEMYKADKQSSLLLCLLKCLPLYQIGAHIEEPEISSEETVSSVKSAELLENKDSKCLNKKTSATEKCKHLTFCSTCQYRMVRLKDKYKKKKKGLIKKINSNTKPVNVNSLIKNIGIMERNLIDEMFQQLKSVYETEVEMVKTEEENKVKRSMASHALQLQKQRDELEESFKAREEALKQSVAQKKKFLWGLARALRDQHEHLSRAMHNVRQETSRLSAKEDSLKSQLAEAEQILKKRGEDMRAQISEELTILEGHLASMKKERDSINRERAELENIKMIENNTTPQTQMDNEELHSHYDLLKNELAILKKYLESSKLSPKCVIERGTITEMNNVNSTFNVTLNNSQIAEKSKTDDFDDRLKDQVVNDFKKKNVNFTPSNLDEIYRERSYSCSRSSGSSEAGDTAQPLYTGHHGEVVDRELVHRLRQENSRLKACSRQQKSLIAALSRAASLAPASTPRSCSCACAGTTLGSCACTSATLRPRTAPPRAGAGLTATNTCQQHYILHGVNTTASANTMSMGWRKGAGEELSIFSDAQPRILVPGDSIPFVGVLRDRDRHGATRKQLLSQWRLLRGRAAPLGGVSKRAPSPHRERAGGSGHTVIVSNTQQATCSMQPESTHTVQSSRKKTQHRTKHMTMEIKSNRDKSPKSLLREAKEKLRNIKNTSVAAREKSPSAVLREAKMRLRKLEIEAEAVEKSYRDFRRRQSELRIERNARTTLNDDTMTPNAVRNLDTKRSHSLQKLEDAGIVEVDSPLTDYQKCMRNDFDRYLREYQTKLDIGETHFRSQTIANIVKPIPEAYSKINEENTELHNGNYLETPLAEFRKLYHTERQVVEDDSRDMSFVNQQASSASDNSEQRSIEANCNDTQPQSRRTNKKSKRVNKTEELEILKQNIQKIMNIPPDNNEVTANNLIEVSNTKEENLLRVEVESVSEVKADDQDLLLVVQNTIDLREVSISQSNSPINMSRQMTIFVSPKESGPKSISVANADVSMQSPERIQRSSSPEQEAHLTRNDVLDAIFHNDSNNKSSSLLQFETSKNMLESSLSDYDKKDDHTDDFSADVDNYNSRTGSETSPISMVKTSEENFWDL